MSDSIYIDGQMPSPERQAELLTKIADQVVKRKLTVPAIMFLESVKPLSFIGSQGMIFLQPIVQAVLNRKEYDELTLMMENRENVEKLLVEIEKQEADWQARERDEREKAKAERAKGQTGNGKTGNWWSRIFGKH